MPIIAHHTIEPEGELGLWRIAESEAWFLRRLELAPAEALQLEAIKGRRRTEWLAARQLVHAMSGRDRRGAFVKDEHGKPHLEGSAWHISISHTHGLAAAIAAPRPVGIDVQVLVGRIERLARKYMRPEEMAGLSVERRIEHLHVYWGAKEALYKAYGRRRLDFCENLFVGPFPLEKSRGSTRGRIVKDAFQTVYRIHYAIEAAYVLVWVMEEE
jgi:phosphopantetheinyl transferase